MSSPPSPVLTLGTGGTGDHTLYERFRTAVAAAQLAEWLPAEPIRILDLSTRSPRLVGLMVEHGHTVVHADRRVRRLDIMPSNGTGRLRTVCADARALDWLADESVDAVVAEGGTLSAALVAELTLDDVHRILRPGGRLLLSVDSLVSGLARLADQGRWAELADVPAADVVLIPATDGSVSRCFWPEELHGILAASGFGVDWVRPRTVLAEQTVTAALSVDRSRLDSLVTTELALAARRQGESIGDQLVASARRL